MISFAEKYPEFIKNFWVDEKDPKSLSYGSAKKIKCHCKQGCGNHKWETTPNQVAKVPYCPICYDTFLPYFQVLLFFFPFTTKLVFIYKALYCCHFIIVKI